MTKRSSLAVFTLVIVSLVASVASVPAWADGTVSDASVIATNSVDIDQSAKILSGDVVVNEASTTATLVPGVDLNVDKLATTGTLHADSITLSNGSEVGDLFVNQLIDLGAAVVGTVSPYPATVFSPLPPFRAALPSAGGVGNCVPAADPDPGTDCVVAGGETITLEPGAYGDITINEGATLILSGGGYDVSSVLMLGRRNNSSTLKFQKVTQLRVAGSFFTEQEASILPVDVFARDLVVYVGGANAIADDPNSTPAANLGKNGEYHGNFYVPNGTFELDRESVMFGAAIARDARIARSSELTLDSAFNLDPIAEAQDVACSAASVDITLAGTDPDGDNLSFSFSQPAGGSVVGGGSSYACPVPGDPNRRCFDVTYTPTTPPNPPGSPCATDSFTFTVDDGKGGTDSAAVDINPSDDTPPEELDEVLANDQICQTDQNGFLSCDIECAVDHPDPLQDCDFTLVLTGAAPCNGDCDANDDTPLTFSIVGAPSFPAATSQGGELDNLVQGSGHLLEPPLGPEVPQRSATIDYSPPPAPFLGVDSFFFEVAGEVNGVPQTDQGRVDINILAYQEPPPVQARDQSVTTTEETPVEINLSGPPKICDQTDPDCRTKQQGAESSSSPSDLTGSSLTTEPPTKSATTGAGGVALPEGLVVSSRPATRGLSVPVTSAVVAPPAGATVIDFDNLAAPLLFANTTRLTDEYANEGVIFSGPGGNDGGAVLDSLTFFCPGPTLPCPPEDFDSSPPNVLAFNSTATMEDGGTPIGPERMTFTSPVADVQINAGCGDFVLDANGGSFALDCYDAQGVLLASDSFTTAPNTNSCLILQTLAVSATGISFCDLTFSAVSSILLPGANIAVFDDLAYIRDADLTVSVNHSPASPTTADEVVFTATVENNGGESAGASKLTFEIVSRTTGQLLPDDPQTFLVPALGAGETFQIFRPETLDADTWDVTVVADSDDEVSEADEGNNTATDSVEVTASVELLPVGYSITSLPSSGALSYPDPFLPDTMVTVAGPLPALLPSELVVYTPFPETSGTDSFGYGLSNGSTSATGTISILVEGVLVIPDECAAVGRPPGCSVEAGEVASTESASSSGFDGPKEGLTIVVEGAGGSVATSPVTLEGGKFLYGLGCSEGSCSKWFPAGAQIKLFARPDGEHFEFLGWGGNCRGSEPIITVTLDATTLCTARFARRD